MRGLALTLLMLPAIYLVAWIGWCMTMMGTDFGYVHDYFRDGWTGGGEKPTFIQLFEMTSTLLAAPVVWFVVRRRRNSKSLNAIPYVALAIVAGTGAYGTAWYFWDKAQSKVEWSILEKAAHQDRFAALVGPAVIAEADGYHLLRVEAENGRDHVWIMLDAKHEPLVKRLLDLPYRIAVQDAAKVFSSGVASMAVRIELTMYARR
ncbi:MAG: hypothetical protein J0J01_25280 [Reyranella sp.]|uniref:hypothetical protein n=1 Tax=Reyranella sp. TaxID=1929291 RepID=UPI001AC096B5|nr:hypothetical protein [Reyranella sp.]MBN9090238.1 hypothetical protein [Reyranella sp.]